MPPVPPPVKSIFIFSIDLCFIRLDTLNITPTSAKEIASAVPPWETKISGTPTKGTSASAEAILKND